VRVEDDKVEDDITTVRVDVVSASMAFPQAEQERLLPARTVPQAGQFILR
jgi:hypothetical protein